MTDPTFANETQGPTLIPFAIMSGAWLGPLLMFWLYVWGPLRPFHYTSGDVAPNPLVFIAGIAVSILAGRLPDAYFRIRDFERSGRIYVALGVRWFRYLVPDGDLANRWRRRTQPGFRIVPNRRFAAAFVDRTRLSEKSHMILLVMGVLSAFYAARIGWNGWAAYIAIGNIPVNLYPMMLQRYTRARLERMLHRR